MNELKTILRQTPTEETPAKPLRRKPLPNQRTRMDLRIGPGIVGCGCVSVIDFYFTTTMEF